MMHLQTGRFSALAVVLFALDGCGGGSEAASDAGGPSSTGATSGGRAPSGAATGSAPGTSTGSAAGATAGSKTGAGASSGIGGASGDGEPQSGASGMSGSTAGVAGAPPEDDAGAPPLTMDASVDMGGDAAGAPDSGQVVLGDGGSVTAHLDDVKRAFLAMQFGIWHHFGILTYTGSWAQGNLPINDFNPGTTLNPQQWAQAAKSAGAGFGVLTTRHHDGFALWPSKASNFNVGHTSWYAQVGGQAGGSDKGDVVLQFVNGYRAEGLLPAFYYSIWDTTHPVNGNITTETVQYLTTQLTELMSNYGKIPLLIIDGWSWMMGHHAAEGWYIHNLVKSLQPDILIVDHEGIESPYDEDLVMYEEPRGVFSPAGNTWAAVQGQKVNAHGGNDWFWKSNISGLISVSDIVDTHINTLVPRYTNFILNCPPNSQGLLDADIVTLLGQVGTYRKSHPAAVPPSLPSQGEQNSNPYFIVTATASSGTAGAAIDGSNDIGRYTIWQSTGSLPQWIQADLGSSKSVGFVGYVPPYQPGSAFNTGTGRCSGTPCAVPATSGLITSYEVQVSVDGTTFTKATSGTWIADGKLKGVTFPAVQGRYVRLVANGVNSGASAQATEIEVGGPQTLTLATPTVSDWGH